MSQSMLAVGLGHYLAVASVLFLIGLLGVVLNRRNMIVILMAIELMLLAVNINFVAFSSYGHNLAGQAFAMIILAVAAAESAIGLAILVVAFRHRGSVEVADLSGMKG